MPIAYSVLCQGLIYNEARIGAMVEFNQRAGQGGSMYIVRHNSNGWTGLAGSGHGGTAMAVTERVLRDGSSAVFSVGFNYCFILHAGSLSMGLFILTV